ncbi:unnamed protein product [Timema podura]|uniref:Uncharacterized protein n=1 Tax=Timema podura TaxID=61482 RepID=A0ABN7NF44_TIMPD|nr:unnamed protein product [Timema podura]
MLKGQVTCGLSVRLKFQIGGVSSQTPNLSVCGGKSRDLQQVRPTAHAQCTLLSSLLEFYFYFSGGDIPVENFRSSKDLPVAKNLSIATSLCSILIDCLTILIASQHNYINARDGQRSSPNNNSDMRLHLRAIVDKQYYECESDKLMNKPLEVGLDGKYALCLENSHKLSQEVIKEMFSKYGEVHSIRYVGQSLVFIRYYNFDDASACLNDLSSTYSIHPARTKKKDDTQERLPGGDNFRRRSPGEDRFERRSPVGDQFSRSSNREYNTAKSSARPQTTTSSTQTQHVVPPTPSESSVGGLGDVPAVVCAHKHMYSITLTVDWTAKDEEIEVQAAAARNVSRTQSIGCMISPAIVDEQPPSPSTLPSYSKSACSSGVVGHCKGFSQTKISSPAPSVKPGLNCCRLLFSLDPLTFFLVQPSEIRTERLTTGGLQFFRVIQDKAMLRKLGTKHLPVKILQI